MSSAKAIFCGAVLIAASILLNQAIRPAVAMVGGSYQIMHHSNNTATAGVFRLDTTTGEISYCYVMGQNGADLTCTKAIH